MIEEIENAKRLARGHYTPEEQAFSWWVNYGQYGARPCPPELIRFVTQALHNAMIGDQ